MVMDVKLTRLTKMIISQYKKYGIIVTHLKLTMLCHIPQ